MTLVRRLRRSSPVITLGYYAHFMPEAGSEGRGESGSPIGTPHNLPSAVDR